jgi:hypothetical protein
MRIRIDRRSQLWFGIFVIGGVMASGTLCGRIGQHEIRADHGLHDLDGVPVIQCFERASRGAKRIQGSLRKLLVWAAIGLSVALQVAVIYTPFLQRAFSTASLNFCRLVTVYDGGKLGAVAARTEQSRNPGGE